MNKLSRRGFLEVTGAGLGSLTLKDAALAMPSSTGSNSSAHLQELSGPIATLYAKFLDPDRKYSIRPFWFWNGALTGEELKRQINQMVKNGVYGAYAHNRDGLATRYLSEEWWKVLGEALQAAKEAGFSLCMVDEFEWPSGEARDPWMPGINKSHVIEANPDFHARRMRSTEHVVRGPQRWSAPLAEKTVAIVASKRLGPDRLDSATLQALAWGEDAKEVSWEVPEGEWLIIAYDLVASAPRMGSLDLMNRDATATFIKLYYEEFYRRHGQYFGNTMPATFADHEGSYGDKLPWTPRLFETFRRKSGYELLPLLPGLIYDIGPKTEKLRCDMFDTISELYSDGFFKQVGDWCKQYNIQYSGHTWEESLFWGAAFQGDYYRILRSMAVPGCDSLVEWGRDSVYLREAASVAAFEGTHLVCENQGVEGQDSYISPELMRRTSNCLAAWDVGEFIPHAFNYDLARTNFPPDWFRSQPFLPWFRAYADQMRRVSFVNRESQRIADVLVLYPQVSIWGQASRAFGEDPTVDLTANSNWSPDAAETSNQYLALKKNLTDARFDFMVADDEYLAKSAIEGGRLRINRSEFRVLILPPMSTTRRSTARRVRDFFRAGGTVVGHRRLPFTSVEMGREDPELINIWHEVFDLGASVEPFVMRKGADGGRSYRVTGSVADVAEINREAVDPDVELMEGPGDRIFAMHKRNGGVELYWIVNDTATARNLMLRFRAGGRPEKWDAASGKRSPLFYETQGGKTVVRLALGPSDAAYVVFDPAGESQTLTLAGTSLEDFHLLQARENEVIVHARGTPGEKTGHLELHGSAARYRGEYRLRATLPLDISDQWKVTVEAQAIDLPYASVRDDPANVGLKNRWYWQLDERANWNPLWLSPQLRSIRKWNALGMFPNPEDGGLDLTFAPETEAAVDYSKVYVGNKGQQIHWQEFSSDEDLSGLPWLDGFFRVAGGRYGANAYVANYGRMLRSSVMEGTAYVQTNIYHPSGGSEMMVLGAPLPTTVFLNHEKVYSRWVRPLYSDPIDGFSTRIPVTLKAGWNSLLIKLLHNAREDDKPPQLTCRIEHASGDAIEGLVANSRVTEQPPTEPRGYRWLNFAVPAVAASLRIPSLRDGCLAFVDGKEVPAAEEIPLPRGTRNVTLRVRAREALDQPFAFATIPATMALGTWKVPGLEHFSGTMVYERSVDVPASLLAERVLLDCGVVGVCAEAWVNGKAVGKRAWSPFTFDVTEQLHPGRNQIRVRVANTEGNRRAVGPWIGNLANIDIDGWHGPARLVPFFEGEIVCARV